MAANRQSHTTPGRLHGRYRPLRIAVGGMVSVVVLAGIFSPGQTDTDREPVAVVSSAPVQPTTAEPESATPEPTTPEDAPEQTTTPAEAVPEPVQTTPAPAPPPPPAPEPIRESEPDDVAPTAPDPEPEPVAPLPTPDPEPEPVAPAPAVGGTDPDYGTCEKAKAAGKGPYIQGVHPEYDWYRDADNDGEVCDR